jgi:hypothetical protein
MNESPKNGDFFLVKKKFRFIPDIKKNGKKIIIELEIYQYNICVLSFYEHKNGGDDNKYRLRTKIGAGQIKARFRACLEAFNSLPEFHALIFAASNDLNEVEEDNQRYSAYKLFLNYYLKDIDKYINKGSLKYNTFLLYHNDYEYKSEADTFYYNFENKIAEEITKELDLLNSTQEQKDNITIEQTEI